MDVGSQGTANAIQALPVTRANSVLGVTAGTQFATVMSSVMAAFTEPAMSPLGFVRVQEIDRARNASMLSCTLTSALGVSCCSLDD